MSLPDDILWRLFVIAFVIFLATISRRKTS